MPDLYKKSFDEILSDNRLLASVYVPEWKPLDDSDLGVSLIEIFSHMQEEIYSRLNRVPNKNFISFLDMLGVRLMPALPATAPVTFYLAEGLQNSVFISSGTQVATAETENHGALTFETTKSISAINATIDRVYSVNPEKDEIYSHSADFNAGKPFRAFEGENIQKHILYLGHSTLFKLKEPRPILLRMVLDENAGMEDIKSWKWSRINGKPFSSITISKDQVSENGYSISLMPDAVIEETSVFGRSSLWIECSTDVGEQSSNPVTIKKILLNGVSPDRTIDPDIGFYNSLPIDLSQKFYPFGRLPRIYDTFYLSSTEAFSKKNSEITITFRRVVNANPTSIVAAIRDVEISWEYWNGSIWHVLKMKNNTLEDFTHAEGYIAFERPDDMSVSEVNGVEDYWIRARLVNVSYSGDLLPGDTVDSPVVNSVKIGYSLTEESSLGMEHCLTYNNIEFRDVTADSLGQGFKPFIPLWESVPTLYVGFKEPLLKGNLSLYFSMIDEQQSSRITPEVIWSNWTLAPNLLKMENNDASILEFSSVEGLGIGTDLLLEEEFQNGPIYEASSILDINESLIDQNRKVKIVNLGRRLDHAFTARSRVLRRNRLDVLDSTGHLSKSGTLEMLGPADHQISTSFGEARYWLMATMNPGEVALITGIYPNTVWVAQIESITDEILGSSGGEKDSSYSFVKRPVISPDVWVREGAAVTDPGLDIQVVLDSSGKIIDAWVRWNRVDDFFASGPRDRHYVLDGASGQLIFGDGINGLIPPIGSNNIKASYKSGGGLESNVAIGEINAIKTPLAGIDHVLNYAPANGGSDTESIESVMERGPYVIKTMDRAVTAEDFERLAKASSSYISRARSLVAGSKVNVIVIPRGKEDRPMPSPGLLKIVKGYLLERSLSSISSNNLEVIAPAYKEIRITVDVIPKSIDLAVPLEREVQKKLKEFLHPLTGGPNGKGWDFGRPIRISDIYSLLEYTDGVDHVESLLLNDSADDVEVGGNQLACSGNHTVNIRLGDQP
jgi:hypothetical protein